MSSHRQNKKKKLVMFITILLVLLFIINSKTNGSVSNVARMIAAPVWSIGDNTSAKITNVQEMFASKDELANKLESLSTELEDIRNLEYENMLLKAQNANLLSLASVGVPVDISHKRIHANVFSTSGILPYGTILVSGADDDIQTGDIVLGRSAIALGNVASTSGDIATVHLFSTANRIVDVVMGYGESAISAKAEGVGNGNFTISTPRDVDISIGDMVFATSASGYPIAIVGSIEQDPVNAFKKIYARVPFNIQVITSVLVE